MSEMKQEIEAKGQDVEAAIEAGLKILNVSRNDVIVEVVDEGTRGLLGIGSRDAVVRLTSIATLEPVKPVDNKMTSSPLKTEKVETTRVSTRASKYEGSVEEAAVEITRELLDKMQVNAEVTIRLSEPDDLTGESILVIDIHGNDLGLLIGPHGETLNAIQQITRLMVSHQLQTRANFVIDIQSYRQRREKALERLANRMAKKVYDRKRPISLEPMPPNERRIIHMTLRDDENVYTQSTGEGKRRRIRILPKKED